MYNWKHGKKGSGVYWLQQARDEARLNRIAQQMFDSVGRSISDESFRVNIIYSLNKYWRLVLGLIFSSNFFFCNPSIVNAAMGRFNSIVGL